MTRNRINPIEAADAAVEQARESSEQATNALAAAEAHVRELRSRNECGDTSVTGLDMLEAEAEVERTRGLAQHATTVLVDKQREAADVVAQEVAADVAKTFTLDQVDERVEKAGEQVANALAAVVTTLRERDAASDAAGERLRAAGVPQATQVGRIRYAPVKAAGSQRAIPGQWNLTVDGERITRRDDHNSTRRESQRMVEHIVTTSLRELGWKWGRYGVESI